MAFSWATYSAAVPAHSRSVLLGSLSHCQYRTRPAQWRTRWRTNSPYACWSRGGRRGQEVGRLPGGPGRAGAQRDPDFLVPAQLVQQRVDRVPDVAAGLGFDLAPVEVRADQAGAESTALRDELVGLAEQSVADPAHHAEPDPRRVEGAGRADAGGLRGGGAGPRGVAACGGVAGRGGGAGHGGLPPRSKVYAIYSEFISYTQLVRKPVTGPPRLIWTQPPPRQRSLGRAEIVAAAIDLADEGGPAAVTMHAVAGWARTPRWRCTGTCTARTAWWT